jgi:voltage-gated sodium channel
MTPAAAPRAALARLVDHAFFQRGIIALIGLNAVTLGLETSPSVMAAVGPQLVALDRAILAVFVVEIALRLGAHGPRFFRDPWSVFDLAVVAIALVPASEALSVLRSLRILRALRLISAVPRMRQVVQGLLGAIPGIAAIIALLLLVFYVSAVIATKLFAGAFPDWFATSGRACFPCSRS